MCELVVIEQKFWTEAASWWLDVAVSVWLGHNALVLINIVTVHRVRLVP